MAVAMVGPVVVVGLVVAIAVVLTVVQMGKAMVEVASAEVALEVAALAGVETARDILVAVVMVGEVMGVVEMVEAVLVALMAVYTVGGLAAVWEVAEPVAVVMAKAGLVAVGTVPAGLATVEVAVKVQVD